MSTEQPEVTDDATREDHVQPELESAARPWGLPATLGFIVVTAIAFVLAQQGVAVVYLAVLMGTEGEAAVNEVAANIMSDGTLLATATLVSGLVCTTLVVFFAWLRRGMEVRRYLALQGASVQSLTACLGVLAITIVATDLLTYALGRPIVPEYMLDAYRSCAFLPLLWVAIVLAAPIFEEVFVRGFIFAGLESSRLGGGGAVVITSLLWTVVHMQYDLYQLGIVFLMGLIIGTARLKTGSLVPCIAMHVFANLVATVETTVVVHLL